jgi:hypothetical protein
MFEALRRFGGYRVDYMNEAEVGSANAVAFYVCGDLPAGAPYSQNAKHRLLMGLEVMRANFGLQNLVAVYLDVNSPDNLERPAYMQMKQDLQSGKFRRLFVWPDCSLLVNLAARSEMLKLYMEVGGFEMLTYDPASQIVVPVNLAAVQCKQYIGANSQAVERIVG